MKARDSLFSLRLVTAFLLGVSSGLPLLTTLDMLKAWLTDSGVSLETIGLSGLFGLPYTLKFLWAPAFDRYLPPLLGRRRGWMVIMQVAVMAALVLLSRCDPVRSPYFLGLCVLFVTFFSASQDILLDAHRRDCFSNKDLALASSYFLTGYRIGMLLSGAVALNLAMEFTWPQVYLIMAACMLVGIVATLLSEEPEISAPPPKSMREAIFEPLRDYFVKPGAILILTFILFFKLGDMIASTMTIPFYKAIGFNWGEVGRIAKVFGILSTLCGGLAGGLIANKIGLYRALWVFGILQAIGILGFPLLLISGPDIYTLAAVISFENFSIGLATSAFVTLMGLLCNTRFSATQYALLTSLSGVPRTLLGSSSGALVKSLGWANFFILCFILAIPGLILLGRVRKFIEERPE